MFQFSQEQKTFEVNGVKFGGQPGESPTVMIGSIFYKGDSAVEDPDKGVFDEEKALQKIEEAQEYSEKTGNPLVVDVVGETGEALENYIEFIGNETDVTFSVDGTSADARIRGVEYVGEAGLEDRAIYNSVSTETQDKEIEALEKAGIDTTIALCYNPNEVTMEGRMKSLEKIMDILEGTEINNYIVDTSTLDLPEPGLIGKTIYKVKEKYGFPAGSGVHNAVDQWRERADLDREKYMYAAIVANVFPLAMGADFVLYGGIDDSEEMFFACGLADAYVGYSMNMEYGLRLQKDHPLRKVFRAW